MRWLLFLLPWLLMACSTTAPGTFAPDDPRIGYLGRFDFTEPDAPRFDWSAATIRFGFTGTSAAVLLDDGNNDYNVWLNDAPPFLLQTTPGKTTYLLAQNLPTAAHTVRLVKRTEASLGAATFRGIVLDADAELVAPPPLPARKLLFFGDSITAGYGNEGASPDCPFSRETENVEQGYAALTARAFGAAYVTVAYSGMGMVRNYGSPAPTSAEAMPVFFDRSTATAPSRPWDPTRWQPDVLVVNLGTNDFSTQPHPSQAQFTEAYRALLTRARTAYPSTEIVAVAGPFMTDPAPGYIRTLVTAVQAEGETRLHLAEITNTLVHPSDFGCASHPNVAGHRKIAEQLIPQIGAALGWAAEE